jgi:hypothetical protein
MLHGSMSQLLVVCGFSIFSRTSHKSVPRTSLTPVTPSTPCPLRFKSYTVYTVRWRPKVVEEKYTRTNIFMLDRDLWNWAHYRAKSLGFKSVSEYVFDLIKKDRKASGK